MTLPASLAPYFQTSEFEVTNTGFANRIPDLTTWCQIRTLCSAVLVPLRERIGPIKITSGWRSHRVNMAVGGSSTTDHHAVDDADDGAASDIKPLAVSQREAWAVLLDMMRHGLPVDQAIFYPHTGHIHIGHRQAVINRREADAQRSCPGRGCRQHVDPFAGAERVLDVSPGHGTEAQ